MITHVPGLPYRYRVPKKDSYCKQKAVRLGIKHKTVDGHLYTAKPL